MLIENCEGLSQEQKESIIPIIEGKCSTLVPTGGPGTGKSTVLLATRRMFIKSGISVYVLTFTGKSSNRLNMEISLDSDENTVESMTIHRFYYKLKNLGQKVKGLLIIDEASTKR
jgi:DNA replication protein DnaC